MDCNVAKMQLLFAVNSWLSGRTDREAKASFNILPFFLMVLFFTNGKAEQRKIITNVFCLSSFEATAQIPGWTLRVVFPPSIQSQDLSLLDVSVSWKKSKQQWGTHVDTAREHETLLFLPLKK